MIGGQRGQQGQRRQWRHWRQRKRRRAGRQPAASPIGAGQPDTNDLLAMGEGLGSRLDALTSEIALLRSENALLRNRSALLRQNKILMGAFFSNFSTVWSFEEVSFIGAFRRIRRGDEYRINVHEYQVNVDALLADGAAAPAPSVNSARSGSQQMQSSQDVFGEPYCERAHLVPHAKVCSPAFGVVAQAVFGVDLENNVKFSGTENRENLILALQQLMCGPSNNSSIVGLKNSQFNRLALPPGTCGKFR